MASREVPEPWAQRMADVGLVHPRSGRPSMRRLAEAADVHTSTISAMMFGDRATQPDVVDRVAEVLYPEAGEHWARRRRGVHAWVGRAVEAKTPFQPHPDADLLTVKERAAVNEVIRLLAAGKKTARPGLTAVATELHAAHEDDLRAPPIDEQQERTTDSP